MAEETIGGYKLVKMIATGAASQVYEVVETSSGRHFAMKLLLPERVDDSAARHFLLHEAEVGLKLAHPNIIRIFKVDRAPKNPFFVMEFFPAGSLKVRISRKDVNFIRERGQDVLKQAATAYAFMNAQGWVHRDIKPDNILVNSAGEVKIIDFAIAQRIPTGLAKWFRRKGKPQGTHRYMSPEQIRCEPLDGRADIYSFGASAYELVAGRPPFSGSSFQDILNKQLYEKPVTPKQHNPDVTDPFAALILQMLAKKREERPKDFHEVLMKMRTMQLFKGVSSKPATS